MRIWLGQKSNAVALAEQAEQLAPDDPKLATLLRKLEREFFDLRPYGLVNMLELIRPIYQQTAAYGHFGREEAEFTWERIDKADSLRAAAGL